MLLGNSDFILCLHLANYCDFEKQIKLCAIKYLFLAKRLLPGNFLNEPSLMVEEYNGCIFGLRVMRMEYLISQVITEIIRPSIILLPFFGM